MPPIVARGVGRFPGPKGPVGVIRRSVDLGITSTPWDLVLVHTAIDLGHDPPRPGAADG